MIEVRQIFPMSFEYPRSLRDLRDPPSGLMVSGRLLFDEKPVLGIVGSRESSLMAESWMRLHLPKLACEVVTLSGGARGIDELAHRIAVSVKSPTAVVLPSSLDCPYPADWRERAPGVLENNGCLISEFESGTSVRPWHFEKRNRIIAALSDVLLVVEARKRSGTAITARHARELGRLVATLPWFPGDPRGEFCNQLLFEGAMPIRDATDLAMLVQGEARRRLSRVTQEISAVPDSLHEEEGRNSEEEVRHPHREPRRKLSASSEALACDVENPVSNDDSD